MDDTYVCNGHRYMVLELPFKWGSRSRSRLYIVTSANSNTSHCMSISSDILTLQSVLEEGDLELRFHDGRSIKAHSLKLKLASRGGFLHSLIEDVVDDQITGSKRKWVDDSNTSSALPTLKVSR